jgi:hypothetical protein
VSGQLHLDGRVLRVMAPEPGEYRLGWRGLADLHLVVVPAAAPIADGWATSGPLSAELSPPPPVIAALVDAGEHVELRVDGAGAETRVHLLATRYRPDRALPRTLARAPRPPLAAQVAPVISHYVSGRDIGEEYRYVLERRGAVRRPGVLLDKPGLLLNPWALRTTSSAVQHAAAGGAYGASPPRPARAPAPTQARHQAAGEAGDEGAFQSLDFLAAPARVLANLRPDRDGVVRVARAELGDAQAVRAIVVDPALTSVADLALAERGVAHRDLRLRLALDPAGHFAEDRGVDAAPAGTQLVVEDVRSGKLELVDSTARAHQVLLSLGAPDPLREFGFVAEWHRLDDAARRAKYSRYACHELHLFLAFRDPDFFARVVKPYLAHKRVKTFVDRWLLGDDLSPYLEPWAFGRLNTLERVLLARRVPGLKGAIARLVGDAVDLIPPDPERDARLVDTLLGATALEGGGPVGAAAGAAMDDLMMLEEQAEEAPEPPRQFARDAKSRSLRRLEAPAELGLAPPPPPGAPAMPGGGSGGDLERGRVAADLAERRRAAPMFRAADRTQEWAESDWWHVRVEHVSPDLIRPNRFWRDLARHDGAGPFLSPHLGECTDSFAAAMGALAVLDLPFTAASHAIAVDDTRLTVTTGSHALAARSRIAAVAAPEARSAILVGQSYFRADDRWEWDGAEQREKYVTGELLTGVVYQCQVVVTNPTSRHQKLDVLLQIPRGALPVAGGFYTRTAHVHLGAYGTQAFEYAFYVPVAGTWSHFGAHVTRAGELVAHAPGTDLVVVREPSTVDATSWAHVSQHGSTDEVLAFLDRANLGRVDLGRIAWRMRDKDAFARVTALLAARHAYHDRLWAYALAHADRGRMAEWLRHQDPFVRQAGPALEGGIVDLDPVERAWYQHLEYAPLVNARAHQLGARRRILDDALAGQYRGFLEILAHRAEPGHGDRLAAAHYLFAMDRVDDALAQLAAVDADRVPSRLQHDYLAAYAACCRGDLAEARRLAAAWADHPVDRWRHRFAALAAMLDDRAAAVDADSRDQRMAEAAARQPALELLVEHGAVVVQHHNVAAVQLRFYRMDIELLFSRQPFVQGDVERFSWIEPGAVIELPLAGDGRTPVPLPEAMRGANLVIEAVAPGLRRAIAHYAHDLATQLAHQYGQVRVLRASTQQPLPATYVKVYARQQGGVVAFYKDGYTDLRGRFDYATLSTDDLDRVERFALLVVSDDAGAAVLEAAPPPR